MKKTKETLPKWYRHFLKKYPDIAKKYTELGDAVHGWGPLDNKTRALVKLAISGTSLQKSAFRSHIYKAKNLGISREAMEHVALLTLPTLGFPSAMTLLSIIDKEFSKS